ncbi:hypothetical protein CJ030_MR7G026001 [Morella rubra]|uniref:Uncharacterized protein n=1 Tax=Morella rubra TaxID=262757 RepID=A0A6A1V0E6_9ROSI|nr:hypothetical protein CJ030_MR7G026001 [Morella rubra]
MIRLLRFLSLCLSISALDTALFPLCTKLGVTLFKRDELRWSQLKVAKVPRSWSPSQLTLAREALKQLGFCS